MFPITYWCERFFANRYFAKVGAAAAPPSPAGGYFPVRYFCATYFAKRYFPTGAAAVVGGFNPIWASNSNSVISPFNPND